MTYRNGSLGSDGDKVDWRKKYKKRKESIDDIIGYAKRLFDGWDYHLTKSNCQDFAEKVIWWATT